jgi:hypothetical protein
MAARTRTRLRPLVSGRPSSRFRSSADDAERVGIGLHRWRTDPEYQAEIRRQHAEQGCETDPETGRGFVRYVMAPDKQGKGRHPVIDPGHWRALARHGNEEARATCERLGYPWQKADADFREWRARWIRHRMGGNR